MINRGSIGHNEMVNSELSSSLVTSYNSDDRGDQLRVREVTKNQGNSTKRSRTSPISSFKAGKGVSNLSPTRVKKVVEKVSKKDDLKRMRSSTNEKALRIPMFEGQSGSKGSQQNGSACQTDCGSKGSSRRNSLLRKTSFCLKPTLERKKTGSVISPASATSMRMKLSQNSQSKSRSNSKTSKGRV